MNPRKYQIYVFLFCFVFWKDKNNSSAYYIPGTMLEVLHSLFSLKVISAIISTSIRKMRLSEVKRLAPTGLRDVVNLPWVSWSPIPLLSIPTLQDPDHCFT
jgi:hypothetical protein